MNHRSSVEPTPAVAAPGRTHTLVVGAGPQALTVLARWVCARPACVRDVTIIDPAGSWLQAWSAGFAQQRIDVLRSPGVHHPDPDDMAYIHAHPTRQTFDASCAAASTTGSVGPLRRPTTSAFWSFCQDLLDRTGLGAKVVPASVAELRLVGGEPSEPEWEARLDDGRVVTARRVVWAANPRRPRVPPDVELGGVIEHSATVDLDRVDGGERIAVIGGGQTAGQLALRAAQRGASVTLIARGPRRVADLDVDAGWLMDDHLGPFRELTDPADRRRAVEAAQVGSVTADLDLALQRAHVSRVADAGDVWARRRSGGAVIGFAGVECAVDRVWAATGSVPDLRASPALAALAAGGAPQVDGWPVLDSTLQWCDGLFVVGALAALTLGPAAGNLGGARAAADLLAELGPG